MGQGSHDETANLETETERNLLRINRKPDSVWPIVVIDTGLYLLQLPRVTRVVKKLSLEKAIPSLLTMYLKSLIREMICC